MELIKPHHKPSEAVTRKNLARATKEASDLVSFLEEGNKAGFKGNWKNAIGISHCQVSNEPLAMFVVSSDIVGKPKRMTRTQNKKNYWFPANTIFNAKIVEACDSIERLVPKHTVVRVPNSKETKIEKSAEMKPVSNIIDCADACMSYPDRTKKTTKRYHTIKVQYQVLQNILGFKRLKTITETVTGFKAHVFQHEIDHSFGIDMYFGDGINRQVEKPYKNLGAKPSETSPEGVK